MGKPISVEDAFFAYAKDKTTLPPTLIKEYLKKASDYCHLRQPLLGMSDVQAVRNAQQKVANGMLLRFRYGKDAQHIREVTHLYYCFVKTYRPRKISEETDSAVSQSDRKTDDAPQQPEASAAGAPSVESEIKAEQKKDVITETRDLGSAPHSLQPAHDNELREIPNPEQMLDADLQQLLDDDEFAPLREELIRQRIFSLERFKAENIWVFMNRYALYSISQRQDVYRQILSKLKPAVHIDKSKLYQLKSKSAVYTGTTVAEAFAAFCEAVAQKYPLKFRALIGQQYNGTGSIVLSRSETSLYSVRIANPICYVNASLSAQASIHYGKWICVSCGDTDFPLQMIEPKVEARPRETDKTGMPADDTSSQESPSTDRPVYMPPAEVEVPASPSKPDTTAFRKKLEGSFRYFLINTRHLAEGTVSQYCQSIEAIEQFMIEQGIPCTLVDVNASQAQKVNDTLVVRPDFTEWNKQRHHQYSAALAQYILFLRSFQTEQETIQGQQDDEGASVLHSPKSGYAVQTTDPVLSGNTKKAEQIVLEADLEGMTMDDLAEKLKSTMVAAKKAVQDSAKIALISGRLIHIDAFVDWEDGADQLERILDKLMDKNGGYVSSAQLYEYARAEMQMFLNDNDMDDPHKVYDIAQFLFWKTHYHGKHYAFWMGVHISRDEMEITSTLDVMRHFARERGGFFRESELVEYLEQVKIKTGNLRGQMKVYEKPIFLFYEPGVTYITVESIGINRAWLTKVSQKLDRLFNDMGDHVVLRDIQPGWFAMLPSLPAGRPWTALLLQSVLRFYSQQLGARTIYGLDSQAGDTLHAMVVTLDSEVQTFADAVAAVFLDNHLEQRAYEAEELRQILLKFGLIAGNELIWKMPKVLAKDERFAWDAAGKYVTIKV